MGRTETDGGKNGAHSSLIVTELPVCMPDKLVVNAAVASRAAETKQFSERNGEAWQGLSVASTSEIDGVQTTDKLSCTDRSGPPLLISGAISVLFRIWLGWA